MTFVFPRSDDNRLLRETGAPDLPATLSESLGASFDDPTLSLTDLAGTQADIAETSETAQRTVDILATGRQRRIDLGIPEPESDVAARGINLDTLSPEEAKAQFDIKVDKPIPQRTAEILGRIQREERIRKDIIARAPQGVLPGTLRFGASFARAAIDPVNIASAFIPVVSQARFAGMAARLGVTRARLATGTIEGAVGNALIEPFVGVLADEQLLDYTMADALVNIAFGGILGGGLHVAVGRVGDRISLRSAEARENALRAAVAQSLRGERVDIDPVFRSEFDALNPDRVIRDEARVPPPAREFDLGQPTGTGRGQRFVDYTPVSPQDRRFIEGLVVDLRETGAGERVFLEADRQGGTPEVRGRKASTPKFFQDHNLAANAERQRIAKIKEANKTLPSDQQVPVPKTPDILTRRKVETVASKMLEGKPLGRQEGEIARLLFDVAREQRLENARQMVEFRRERDAERAREIDAFAERELQDIARDQGAPIRDNAADFQASEEAAAVVSRGDDDLSVELLQNDADDLAEQVQQLREAGLITEREAAELEELSAFVENAESYERAARAAALCLARRS